MTRPRYCIQCGTEALTCISENVGFECNACGHRMYLNSKPAAMALFIENYKVLLVRDNEGDDWDLPGGFLNYGEKPYDGLRRECAEELSVEVGRARLVDVVVDKYMNDEWSLAVTFVVDDYSGEARPSNEVVEVGWFGSDNLPPLRYTGVRDVIDRYGPRGSEQRSRISDP